VLRNRQQKHTAKPLWASLKKKKTLTLGQELRQDSVSHFDKALNENKIKHGDQTP